MDGAAKGRSDHIGGEGFFRDKSVVVLGWFASYYDIYYSLHPKLLVAMFAIEKAHQKG